MKQPDDDFLMPLVAITSVETLGDPHHVHVLIGGFGGNVIEASVDRTLASFDLLETATAFARAVQKQGATRIGVNLGDAKNEETSRDIAFADKLRSTAEVGEIVISAVSFDRITSRFIPGREPTSPVWWVVSFSLVSLIGFLGYFLGWFYAIYLQISNMGSDGSFSCWPEFMCR